MIINYKDFIGYKFWSNWIYKLNVQKLYKGIVFLSVTIFVWLLGSIISMQLEKYEPPLLPKIVNVSTVYKAVKGNEIKIFGNPDIKTKSPITKTISAAKKTKLNLKLVGIIDLEDRGVAMINDGSEVLVISLGENIQTGVKLLDIFSDSVLIDNYGIQEKLILLGNDKKIKKLFTQKSINKSVDSSLVKSKKIKIASSLRKDPLLISKYLRFKPLRKNSKWVGLQIWPKNEMAVFASLGFEGGDVLKKIEGKSIQEMSLNPGIWQKFMKRNSFNVEVERKGKLQTLQINLK